MALVAAAKRAIVGEKRRPSKSSSIGRASSTSSAGLSGAPAKEILVSDNAHGMTDSLRSARSTSDESISVLTYSTTASPRDLLGDKKDLKEFNDTPTTVTTSGTSEKVSLELPLTKSTPTRSNPTSLGEFVSKSSEREGSNRSSRRTSDDGISVGSISLRSGRSRSRRSQRSTAPQTPTADNTKGNVVLHASMPALSLQDSPTTPQRPKGMDERIRKRLMERKSPSNTENRGTNVSSRRSMLSPRPSRAVSERHLSATRVSSERPNRSKTDVLNAASGSRVGGSQRAERTTGGSQRAERTGSRSMRSERTSVRNLGSISESPTTPGSQRQSRQSMARSSLLTPASRRRLVQATTLSEDAGDDKNESQALEQELYKESVETNQKLQKKLEEQAQTLKEQEERIKTLLSEQKQQSGDSDDPEKESMRRELQQMKTTMSKLLQDQDEAEEKWRKRLERAEENTAALRKSMEEASIPERDPQGESPSSIRSDEGDDDTESFVELRSKCDQLQEKLSQLEEGYEEAEANWKHKLQESREQATSKAAELEVAQQRIEVLEQKRQQNTNLPPPSPHSLPSPLVSPRVQSIKKGRVERESFLLQMAKAKKGRLGENGQALADDHSVASQASREKAEGMGSQREVGEQDAHDTQSTSSLKIDCDSSADGRPKERADQLSIRVQRLQKDCKKLKFGLQAKDEEIEKLKQTMAQLQDSKLSLQQELVKYKEQHDLALEDVTVSKQQVEKLQEVNKILNSTMGKMESRLLNMQGKLFDMKETERKRKEEDLDSREGVSVGDDPDTRSMRTASNHSSASQDALLKAAMERKRYVSQSSKPVNRWGVLSGMFGRDSSQEEQPTPR